MTDLGITCLLGHCVVWDEHTNMALRADDAFLGHLDGHECAGYRLVCFNVGHDLSTIESNFRVLAHFRQWGRQHPTDFLLVSIADDVLEAERSHGLGLYFDLGGARALGDQLGPFELLGVRWMLMVCNRNNSVGDGCLDNAGCLTVRGREVLEEMHPFGRMLCCSRSDADTTADFMRRTKSPVGTSHSNSGVAYPRPRNSSDDVAKECAAAARFIGLNGFASFIGRQPNGCRHDGSTEGLFQRLDHFVQLLEPEYVRLGLDHVFDVAWIQEHGALRPCL